jgi:hypothetical protein
MGKRVCERCGCSEHKHVQRNVRNERTGQRERVWRALHTGVASRSLTLGVLCDTCYERERERADERAAARARACDARVALAQTLGLVCTGSASGCERTLVGAVMHEREDVREWAYATYEWAS